MEEAVTTKPNAEEPNQNGHCSEKEPNDISVYTLEEKIVSAVWVHERKQNHMPWEQIMKNFKYRFKNRPPSKQTMIGWERKLFTTGTAHDKTRTGRPIARLMHVPYVKQSIEESPNLSIRERAKELGLPYATLLKILKEDLKMTYIQGESTKKRYVGSANVGGTWRFIDDVCHKKEQSNDREELVTETNPKVLTTEMNNRLDQAINFLSSNLIDQRSQPSTSYAQYAMHLSQMQQTADSPSPGPENLVLHNHMYQNYPHF